MNANFLVLSGIPTWVLLFENFETLEATTSAFLGNCRPIQRAECYSNTTHSISPTVQYYCSKNLLAASWKNICLESFRWGLRCSHPHHRVLGFQRLPLAWGTANPSGCDPSVLRSAKIFENRAKNLRCNIRIGKISDLQAVLCTLVNIFNPLWRLV